MVAGMAEIYYGALRVCAGTRMLPSDRRPSMRAARDSLVTRLREALLTGFAVIIPLLITLYVLTIGAGILVDVLTPVEQALRQLELAPNRASTLVRFLAVILLLLVTLLIGLFAQFRTGQIVLGQFDALIQRVPGIGAVYKSFRQMSDVMLESDTRNFREVKLVEFPKDDLYTLGFETAATPDAIQDAAGHEGMRTLFLPLAPNPVMGGFLAHVPEEHVRDVELTVEEGVRAIMTTGVGITGSRPTATPGLSPAQMRSLNGHGTTMTIHVGREGVDD